MTADLPPPHPPSPGPHAQPETDRFYLTSHLRAAATRLPHRTHTNGLLAQTGKESMNLRDCELILVSICFVLGFVCLFMSFYCPLPPTCLSQQTGPTLIRILPVFLERATSTPAGMNCRGAAGGGAFWPGRVRPTESCGWRPEHRYATEESAGSHRGNGVVTAAGKGSGNAGS